LFAVAAGQTDAGESPKPRGTILIVDNDPVLRMLLAKFLAFVGYSVLEARLGSEALKLASCHPAPIDLLLTDVVMPGMNGFELAAAFVGLQPDAKVLYMSGHVFDVSSVQEAAEKDPDSFLVKPFWAEQLLEKVERILPDPEPSGQTA